MKENLSVPWRLWSTLCFSVITFITHFLRALRVLRVYPKSNFLNIWLTILDRRCLKWHLMGTIILRGWDGSVICTFVLQNMLETYWAFFIDFIDYNCAAVFLSGSSSICASLLFEIYLLRHSNLWLLFDCNSKGEG